MSFIQQVAFEIPDDIFLKLSSGEYIRYGGVVRDAAGKVVTHLKDIPMSKPKDYKNIVIGLGVVTILSVTGLVYVAIKSNRNKKEILSEEPKCVADYNISLCTYLDAIRTGNLDVLTINNLISALDLIKENYDRGTIKIDFSTEQLETLIDLASEYTNKLADANSFELSELGIPLSSMDKSTIDDFKYYLEAQKHIFEKAV